MSASILSAPLRALRYLGTAWMPPLLVDSLAWLWRRGWFRVLVQSGVAVALLAALTWGGALWWTAREVAAIRAAAANAGLPDAPTRIPMPTLMANENGEPFVRAAQALLGRWSRGYYVLNQPEASRRLHAAMSDSEWRCVSAEDRALTLAFLDQPQRLLAWDLLERASRQPGVVFPATPLDEASLLLPQRGVLSLARLRIRLLADAGRQAEADAQLAAVARLVAITVPPPDAVSFLAWHDAVNGTVHLVKRLLAEGRIGDAPARALVAAWGRMPAGRDLLLRLADAERLRLEVSLQERTPLLEPLPPEGLVDLATQAVMGGAAGDWLGEPLRRHLAARLMSGTLAVRQAITAAAVDGHGLLSVAVPEGLDEETTEVWRFCIALENRTRRAVVLTRLALAIHLQQRATGAWPTTLDGLGLAVPAWVRCQRGDKGITLGPDDSQDRAGREALTWTLGRM